jgi:hypothetical protein
MPRWLGRGWARATGVLGAPLRAVAQVLGVSGTGARPGDVEEELVLTAAELREGGRYRVTIERPGRTEELLVRVPPVLRAGTRLRLRGKGELGPDGTPGDLLLRLGVRG